MVVSFSLTSSHSPGRMRKNKHPEKPANPITHRAMRPERMRHTMKETEKQELLQNIDKIESEEGIHYLLIVSRIILHMEKKTKES